MCVVFEERPTFIMILNQITDIFWQIATAVANGTGTTGSAWTFRFTKMRSTACSGNTPFAENKFYEFRPKTTFFFYCFITRLLFICLGLGTFRNLRQFHEILHESQSIIGQIF